MGGEGAGGTGGSQDKGGETPPASPEDGKKDEGKKDAGAPAQQQQTPPEPPKGPDGQPFDPERAERTINALRDERRKEKEEFETFKTRHQTQLDGIAKALGLKDDEAPTAEALQGELSKRDARISELEETNRTLKLRSTVDRVAAEKNAISELVWAELITSGALKDVDPAAAEHEDKVKTAIDDALKRYPQLRRTTSAPRDAGKRGSGDGAPTGSVNDLIRRSAGRQPVQ